LDRYTPKRKKYYDTLIFLPESDGGDLQDLACRELQYDASMRCNETPPTGQQFKRDSASGKRGRLSQTLRGLWQIAYEGGRPLLNLIYASRGSSGEM